MRYIDAGYTVILVSLAIYGTGIWVQRRRLAKKLATLNTPGASADLTQVDS